MLPSSALPARHPSSGFSSSYSPRAQTNETNHSLERLMPELPRWVEALSHHPRVPNCQSWQCQHAGVPCNDLLQPPINGTGKSPCPTYVPCHLHARMLSGRL